MNFFNLYFVWKFVYDLINTVFAGIKVTQTRFYYRSDIIIFQRIVIENKFLCRWRDQARLTFDPGS